MLYYHYNKICPFSLAAVILFKKRLFHFYCDDFGQFGAKKFWRERWQPIFSTNWQKPSRNKLVLSKLIFFRGVWFESPRRKLQKGPFSSECFSEFLSYWNWLLPLGSTAKVKFKLVGTHLYPSHLGSMGRKKLLIRAGIRPGSSGSGTENSNH